MNDLPTECSAAAIMACCIKLLARGKKNIGQHIFLCTESTLCIPDATVIYATKTAPEPQYSSTGLGAALVPGCCHLSPASTDGRQI